MAQRCLWDNQQQIKKNPDPRSSLFIRLVVCGFLSGFSSSKKSRPLKEPLSCNLQFKVFEEVFFTYLKALKILCQNFGTKRKKGSLTMLQLGCNSEIGKEKVGNWNTPILFQKRNRIQENLHMAPIDSKSFHLLLI